MSRRTTSLAVASLAAASLITLGSASASAKDHADWALEFIENVDPEDNLLGTDPDCYINWDLEPAPSPDGSWVPGEGMGPWSAMTKGACFFTLTLQKAMGYTQRDIKAHWGKNKPSSEEYFDKINASPALGAPPPTMETFFRRVTRAVDIQKGDVLVSDVVFDRNDEDGDGNRDEVLHHAHTVIITGAPTEIVRQINPRYSGTKQYAVPIADSTGTSHGCFPEGHEYRDSRWAPGDCTDPDNFNGGAGTGYMRVYTDSLTGILLGFTWSPTASMTSYFSPSKRPYRIGRPFKLMAPQGDVLPPPPP